MTNNNLTLDNWIERKAMNIVYQLDDDSGLSIEFRQANNDKRIDFVEQILNELLSLQHQKDIEQFKRELDKIKEIADGCIYVGKENVEKLEVIKKVIKGYGNKSTI